jgi:hypothetical protein
MAHACNPSYSGGMRFEANCLLNYLENTQHKKQAGGVSQCVGQKKKKKKKRKKKKRKKEIQGWNGRFIIKDQGHFCLVILPT